MKPGDMVWVRHQNSYVSYVSGSPPRLVTPQPKVGLILSVYDGPPHRFNGSDLTTPEQLELLEQWNEILQKNDEIFATYRGQTFPQHAFDELVENNRLRQKMAAQIRLTLPTVTWHHVLLSDTQTVKVKLDQIQPLSHASPAAHDSTSTDGP